MPMAVAKRRVLLVDDVADVRFLHRLALERDGRFEIVGEAADGAEGVELAAALQPDSVVLDLLMPKVDGLTALPRIRAAAPGATVVICSAVRNADVVEQAASLGAAAFFDKGDPLEHLADLLAGPTD